MTRAPLHRVVGRIFFVVFVYVAVICMAVIVRLATDHPAWITYLWGIPAQLVASHLWHNLYQPNPAGDRPSDARSESTGLVGPFSGGEK